MNVEQLLADIRTYCETIDDEWTRYRFAEFLTEAAYPKYKFSEFGRLFLEDESIRTDYERFMDPNNWHSMDRKYVIRNFAKSCAALKADFVECGVYTGGTAFFLCQVADAAGINVHLYDSFEGLSEPGEQDGHYWEGGGLTADGALTKSNLAEFGSPEFHVGWIPKTFDSTAPSRIGLLHVDVDLYEPTFDSLSFFFPRLAAGGIVVLDDHGFTSCPGARAAALDYFKDRREIITDLPTGQGMVIKLPE